MNLNDLDIIEQIHFINEKLKAGYSLSRLDKENIISSRKTISNRFKKIGYELNKDTNQYESIIEVVEGDKSEDKEPILESSNKVVQGNESKNMIIPDYNEEVLTRSFKLYKSTQQRFADFCKRNSKYKVQDILCFLLDDGMNRYE